MSEIRQLPSVSCPRCARMKPLTGGGKIATLRDAADLTEGGLSEETGIPEKTIQRICSGKTSVTVPNFLRLMKALRVKNVTKVFKPEDFE